MNKAPNKCIYCDGQGNGPGAPCGFCIEGKPLDTQLDWDSTWGRIDIKGILKDPVKRANLLSRMSDPGPDGTHIPEYTNDCATCGHAWSYHEQLGACSVFECDCLAFVPLERKRP